MHLSRLAATVSTILLAASTLAAHADTTYTYTGNPFTLITPGSPYTTSNFVSGSFMVATPLGDNLNDVDITPVSFSFSDGVLSTVDNLSLAGFSIATDASGDIAAWIVVFNFVSDASINFSSISGDIDQAENGSIGASFQPGTWTETTNSPVPEPESLMLVGTGLLGVFGVVRRNFNA
jgi:hypothetical protein